MCTDSPVYYVTFIGFTAKTLKNPAEILGKSTTADFFLLAATKVAL